MRMHIASKVQQQTSVMERGEQVVKPEASSHGWQVAFSSEHARSHAHNAGTCGLGPVQRDLYSAFLLAHLEPEQTIPSVTQHVWEGAEPRQRSSLLIEGLQQRANEGHRLPPNHGRRGSKENCPCPSASA